MWYIPIYSPLYGPVTTVDGTGHPTSAALITGRQRRQCRQGRRSIYRDRIIQQKESACNFQKVDYIKDLGVFFDSQLTFSEHIHQKINKAYSMLGIIKRNFIHMDPRTFILLYKALVRPHVEYANSVWSPYKKVT